MYNGIFGRFEYKFQLSYDDMDRMIDDLIPYVKKDDYVNEYGIRTVSCLYLDNCEKECYYGTVNDIGFAQYLLIKVYGRENTGDSVAFLELKTEFNGQLRKRTVTMKLSDAVDFINECVEKGSDARVDYGCSSVQILKEIRHLIQLKKLFPVSVISYERLPLIAAEDTSLRVMFDFNVRSRCDDLDLSHGTGGNRLIPKQIAVLEIKTDKALPLWLVKILAKYKLNNQTVSKYHLHHGPIKVQELNIDENKGEPNNVDTVYRKLTIV